MDFESGSMFSGTADGSVRPSVGAGMLAGEMLGVNSKKYSVYSDKLLQEVRRLMQDKVSKETSKDPVVVPVALSAESLARQVALFPEFRVVCTNSRAGLHPEFEAERCMATAWARKYVKRFGDSVVVMGDALLLAAFAGDEKTHVEFSPVSALAVHSDFQAGHDLARLGNVPGGMEKKYGCALPPDVFQKFLRRKAYAACCKGVSCAYKADGYVCDLSMYPISQQQFVAGMAQAGAQVGMALVPFTPRMVLDATGEIPNTGIGYSRLTKHLELFTPGGTVCAPVFRGDAWFEWLANSRIQSPSGEVYVVELVQTRGSFAYASVTRVTEKLLGPHVGGSKHVLEFRDDAACPKVVAVFDELKGAQYDPAKKSSWVRTTRVYERRLYEKLYAYGMSLKKEDFSGDGMQTLLKRAYVGDNRVTYGGGYVAVQAPLSVQDAHKLVELVFARVFVDRYEMVALGSDLMSEVKRFDAFVSASTGSKVCMVLNHLLFSGMSGATGGCMAMVKAMANRVRAADAPRRLMTPEVKPLVAVWDFSQVTQKVGTSWFAKVPPSLSKAMLAGVRGFSVGRGGFSLASDVAVGRMPDVPDVSGGVQSERDPADGALDVLVDMRENVEGEITQAMQDLLDVVVPLDDVLQGHSDRFMLWAAQPVPDVEQVLPPVAYQEDPDYIASITEAHEVMFPGMADQDFEQDQTSLALDAQDRWMDPDYLRLPVVDTGARLQETTVYKSKLKTYKAERRFESAPELISAINQRNFSASVICEPQNVNAAVKDVWDNFLAVACVPNAAEILAGYSSDAVGFETEVLAEWAGKQSPEKLRSLVQRIAVDGRALEEIPLHEYSLMLKADAKPPMSDKPLVEQVAPQTIAFQDKHASALFSAVLRVITRRFLALLKVNWSVSILKDASGVAQHLANYYPWDDAERVSYLENDFSKYDKSQAELCTKLKLFAYEQLGMNPELLKMWGVAQEFAVVKSMALGIEYTIRDQQKSGDGATSFANVLVNVVSVCTAYKGTVVDCAVFVGDDSFVVTRSPAPSETSVRILAQVFNLQSKFIFSRHLYFASHFFKVDPSGRQVSAVPDPVKRSQRFAQSRPAIDPKWEEMYEGVTKDCDIYRRSGAWSGLETAVMSRYGLSQPGCESVVTSLFNALATGVSRYEKFRGMWEENPTNIRR